MSQVLDVLRRPLVTEKSTRLREENKYVVEVQPWASKTQIKSAIEARFKVNVVGIHTVKVLGKFRRRGGPIGGYQSDSKKAIVKIKAGQQITWEEVA